MRSRDLNTVMAGETIVACEQIRPTRDEPVLAVDTDDGYGAVFTFSVNDAGDWCCDCTATRRTAGRWEAMSSGGTNGAGWETPWRPPRGGWPGVQCWS